MKQDSTTVEKIAETLDLHLNTIRETGYPNEEARQNAINDAHNSCVASLGELHVAEMTTTEQHGKAVDTATKTIATFKESLQAVPPKSPIAAHQENVPLPSKRKTRHK